ncbi:MAG TPA: hypothetical protein VHQ86_06155 [Candidatus Saccharimonadia bacterium]|jgi:hypothetical protein|nr:hypothetical protein [Candidatus Saccharimonadia bacterium]
MFSFSHLIIGLVMMGLGILGVKYTFWIHNLTGPQQWLERYTGSGSTYGVYKIFFALLVCVGILFASGFGDNVMGFLFSPFTRLFHPAG